MQVLGIPYYIGCLFIGMATKGQFSKPLMFAIPVGPLTFSYPYSKSLYYFVHRLRPSRPVWLFFVWVLVLQLLLLSILLLVALALF